jgi:hypothetical protein
MKSKPNKLTPGKNVLFEGSRFIITQHREAILEQEKRSRMQTKPILDDQELELVSAAISESFVTLGQVTLTLFDPFENRELIGVVTKIDQQLRRIRIDIGDEFEWVKMSDIIRASM